MTSSSYLVHIDDVPLESQDKSQGWTISEFRLPLSSKQGSRTAVPDSSLPLQPQQLKRPSISINVKIGGVAGTFFQINYPSQVFWLGWF